MIIAVQLILIFFIASGFSDAATNSSTILHIEYFENPPYIYRSNGKMLGELPYILSYSKNGPCKHANFSIEYGEPMIRFGDLLVQVRNVSATMKLRDKIYALAPFTDKDSIGHPYLQHFHTMVIAKTAGYTMITNKLTKNKIYRIVMFGMSESITLIVALVIFTVVAAILVWLVERRSQNKDADFSYRFLPGIWDGIWWAFVTATTVGYGDKTPKTFLGRLIGLLWLFISISLLSAYTAIMTATITDEIGLKDKKIAYLNGTTANEYILEDTGIPIPAHTYEEALDMTIKMQVYGALLDTNFVTAKQDLMYANDILVEKRFHNTPIDSLFAIVKGAFDKNNTVSNCLKKEFNEHANIHKLKMKENPHSSILKELKPFGNQVSLFFTSLYGAAALLVLIGIVIEVWYLMTTCNKKRNKTCTCATPKKYEVLPKLQESMKNIEKELASIKRAITQIEESSQPVRARKCDTDAPATANGGWYELSIEEKRV